MAYVLGQYNKNIQDSSDAFMTIIPDGTVRRYTGTSSSGTSIDVFVNECIQINNGLSTNNNYYFHGKIKRMVSDQVFYVKLIKYNNDSQEDTLEQYIKTITVTKGDPNDWLDVEFIFTPYSDTFDTILFELQRTVDDYRVEVRQPILIYEEISLINNIIYSKIMAGISLIKMGIQSHPGLLMCINGEEIRISRTGIYEIKNGIILINFFSVVAGADEDNKNLIPGLISEINAAWEAAELIPDVEERQAAKAAIGSRCIFNSNKTRTIDSFSMDYMYQEE